MFTIYLDQCLGVISTLNHFTTVDHVSKHDKWLTKELTNKVSIYHVSRGTEFQYTKTAWGCLARELYSEIYREIWHPAHISKGLDGEMNHKTARESKDVMASSLDTREMEARERK